MTWGMMLANRFGECFPNGDFVGWEDSLNEYYFKQMPEKERAQFEDDNNNGVLNYRYYIAKKLVSETGSRMRDMPPFDEIQAHEVPGVFRTVRVYPKLGAFIGLVSRIFAVNRDLAKLIDRADTGRHKYFPLTVKMANKDQYYNDYSILHIQDYRNSVDVSHSKMELEIYPSGLSRFSISTVSELADIALKKREIEGAHFWRERLLPEGSFCFSDELYSQIKAANLRIPKCVKMMEV